MFIVFNIIVIGLVLLIAYWWANQGLFSALLHLLCVIAAGAIALSLWEPLTVGLLLRGNDFDNYAWGITLVGVFVIALLILRLSMDRIVRANVALPHWANLTFGFLLGAAAGILTIGITLTGVGFIQSTNNVMGFAGMRRDGGGQIRNVNTLWAPVHEWTYEFYSLLSVTSLSTGEPLRQAYPDLHAYSLSLVRDSVKDGRGALSLAPDAARVVRVVECKDCRPATYLVEMSFESKARDFGELLTLSKAQVRLIAQATGSTEPKVAHPEAYGQYSGYHRFDDDSHYATTQPGQATGTIRFEFRAQDLGTARPKYIQIRGTRYELTTISQIGSAEYAALRGGGVSAAGDLTINPASLPIQNAISQSNDIRPVIASTNMKPAGIELTEVGEKSYISGGEGEFSRGGGRVSTKLLIAGVLEPNLTRIVQVDVSRGTSRADIFNAVKNQAEPNAKIQLVDSDGRPYYPIGYIHEQPDGTVAIKVNFLNFLDTYDKIPSLPTSNTHRLRLLFSVTEGATVKGLLVGNITVGTCDLTVRDPRAQTSGGDGGGGAMQ